MSDALIRVLDWPSDKAERETSVCCWGDCQRTPLFSLATPLGNLDYCEADISPAVASLPPEWIEGWREPERLDVDAMAAEDGIPF